MSLRRKGRGVIETHALALACMWLSSGSGAKAGAAAPGQDSCLPSVSVPGGDRLGTLLDATSSVTHERTGTSAPNEALGREWGNIAEAFLSSPCSAVCFCSRLLAFRLLVLSVELSVLCG